MSTAIFSKALKPGGNVPAEAGSTAVKVVGPGSASSENWTATLPLWREKFGEKKRPWIKKASAG
jgi:hypothetical protein